MALFLVVSDAPVSGDKCQGLSGRSSYSCSVKYLVLDDTTEIENFEFDDYEEFMDDDDFREHLISEVEVRPGPFVFGCLDDLFIGVVNDTGDVLWSSEAAVLLGEQSIAATFNPESMEFKVGEAEDRPTFKGVSMDEMKTIQIPRVGFLVKSLSLEEDKPELPLTLEGDDLDISDLQIVVSYGELVTDEPELIGVYWKNQALEIYGSGGAGSTVQYSTFTLEDGDASEIDV